MHLNKENWDTKSFCIPQAQHLSNTLSCLKLRLQCQEVVFQNTKLQKYIKCCCILIHKSFTEEMASIAGFEMLLMTHLPRSIQRGPTLKNITVVSAALGPKTQSRPCYPPPTFCCPLPHSTSTYSYAHPNHHITHMHS